MNIKCPKIRTNKSEQKEWKNKLWCVKKKKQMDVLANLCNKIWFAINKIVENWCRPPCEVVNWKWQHLMKLKKSIKSTSLWGRELKGLADGSVDGSLLSTSLWGRELKGRLPEKEVIPINVDLLVRSWIERCQKSCLLDYQSGRPPCEVVNWKSLWKRYENFVERRPPCEVVNWKALSAQSLWKAEIVDLLVRSWIERQQLLNVHNSQVVDLLVRSWIERWVNF